MADPCVYTFSPWIAEADYPAAGIEPGHVYWISDQAIGAQELRIVAKPFIAEQTITEYAMGAGYLYLQFFECVP